MGINEKRLTGLSESRERERVFVATNQDAKDLPLKSHLKRHWQFACAITYRNAYYSVNKTFHILPKERKRTSRGLGRRVCINFFRTPPNGSFRRIRSTRSKSETSRTEKGNKTNTENASKSACLRVSEILENNGVSLSRRIGFRYA